MGPPIRILVLDDNPNDRALATRALTAEFPGAAIDASVNNDETMRRAIDAGGYDVVVTDYHLRWTTGLEVLRLVKDRNPHCPVVMFTNTGTEEVAVEGMKAGLDDYVIKSPMHFARLGLAVRNALERARFAADRERVMAELAQAKEEAEHASRLKDEFLAIVSHELRTPLNAILGWATLMLQLPPDPRELRQALETIERNARLQARLIDDLLDISRIVSGRLRIELRPVDLRQVVEEGAASVRGAADAKGIRLSVEGSAPPVSGDAARLQQVVWNLLSNSIKFTPSGGSVTATLRQSARFAEFVVTDNGHGIDPAFLPHVFDRFRQADASSTRRHGGLGVGLALVKHLVELHGGSVAAHSAGPGSGTTVTVSLPLPGAAAGATAGAAAAGGGAPGERPESIAGLRVVVVDDDADTRGLIVRMLEGHGAVVAAAASAAEARPLVASSHPDVVVCDIGMPGEDGHDFIRRLRASERGARRTPIPALALTAFAREEERRRALDAGFQAHLAKPVDVGTLVTTVARLSGGRGSAGGHESAG